jgi:hypothetical protein
MTNLEPKLKHFIDNYSLIEVSGRYMPSWKSIELICGENGDDINRANFLKSNDEVTKYFWFIRIGDDLDDIDRVFRYLIIKLKQNYQAQHELLERDDFDAFWQSLAFIYYFEATVAKFKAKNIQTLRKDASALLQYVKKNKLIELEDTDTILFPRHEYLAKFPEYKEAIEIINKWHEHTFARQNQNIKLRELIKANAQLRKQILENRENCEGLHLNICPYCCIHSIKEHRGKISTCGSVECERKYSAGTSRKSRALTKGFARVSQPPKALDGKVNFCDDGCGKRRVLYQTDKGNFCMACCKEKKLW